MYRLIKLTILVHLLPEIDGAFTLNCGATSPNFPDSVTCSCTNSAGTGVEWWEDTTLVSNCFFASMSCSPEQSGYTFSGNQTEQMFTMTVNPYNYSDCKQFTCKDFSDTSIQQSRKPSTIEFDSTMPPAIAEPVSSNTDGDIFITTSCISGYSDLIADWYIVVDGTQKQYIPDQNIVIRQIATSTCTACNSESAATIKLGFQHKEAVDNGALEGYFRLELSHPDYPSAPFNRSTSNVYKVAISGDSGGSNGNGCGLICIILICVGVFLIVTGFIGTAVCVINDKPKPVEGFTVRNVTDSKIALSWEKNPKCCCLGNYILKCSEKEDKVLRFTKDEYEFIKLSPRKTYSLKIQEKTCFGKHGQESTLFVETKGKPIRPNDFKAAANGVTERSITVQWKPGDDGGLPQTFVLMYADQQYEKNQAAGEHTFENLSKGTYYNVSIFARNEIGSSEVAYLYLRTNGAPDPPKNFCVVKDAVTESSIDVAWKPGFDGGYTQKFILKCFKNGHDLEKEEPIPNTKGQTIVHTIKELSASTSYELRIFSENVKGTSKTLPPVTVRTKRLPKVN